MASTAMSNPRLCLTVGLIFAAGCQSVVDHFVRGDRGTASLPTAFYTRYDGRPTTADPAAASPGVIPAALSLPPGYARLPDCPPDGGPATDFAPPAPPAETAPPSASANGNHPQRVPSAVTAAGGHPQYAAGESLCTICGQPTAVANRSRQNSAPVYQAIPCGVYAAPDGTPVCFTMPAGLVYAAPAPTMICTPAAPPVVLMPVAMPAAVSAPPAAAGRRIELAGHDATAAPRPVIDPLDGNWQLPVKRDRHETVRSAD